MEASPEKSDDSGAQIHFFDPESVCSKFLLKNDDDLIKEVKNMINQT